MFIAEEFYDVEMIEQLRFLHQILPSFPPLNTVDNFIWKTNTFFSPRPHHNSCVAFMVMIKQIETFAVSELIMYKLVYGFSLYFSRTFYEFCLRGPPVCLSSCVHDP